MSLDTAEISDLIKNALVTARANAQEVREKNRSELSKLSRKTECEAQERAAKILAAIPGLILASTESALTSARCTGEEYRATIMRLQDFEHCESPEPYSIYYRDSDEDPKISSDGLRFAGKLVFKSCLELNLEPYLDFECDVASGKTYFYIGIDWNNMVSSLLAHA